MHSNVIIKNVSWPQLTWQSLYIKNVMIIYIYDMI